MTTPTYTDPGSPPLESCDPGTIAFSCIGTDPVVHPGFTTFEHERHYRVWVVFAGAAFALVLAGIGLAVDRR